ncbi:relaxase/mobilization nuclease domain-containing protein (plasmid) [Fibrella sp. ES10-3-2-2]
MIGKVARFGSSFLGAIQYCYYETRTNRSLDRTRLRGELLYAQHVGVSVVTDQRLRQDVKQRLNIGDMADSMKSVAALNDRIRKPVWHQSFSFPIGECPPAEVMLRICQSFARTFGMENNPMVAFRHRDCDHEHFHIVASRIDLDGKNTAKTSFNYREVGRFCRAMEKRHGLMPGTPMNIDNPVKQSVVTTNPARSEQAHIEQRPITNQTKTVQEPKVRQPRPTL